MARSSFKKCSNHILYENRTVGKREGEGRREEEGEERGVGEGGEKQTTNICMQVKVHQIANNLSECMEGKRSREYGISLSPNTMKRKKNQIMTRSSGQCKVVMSSG